MIREIITKINGVLYYPVLLVLLLGIGLYFTFRTRFLQFRLFNESVRLVLEKPKKNGEVSSFQALMVSTASRVGTGNIVGVSSAICLGGYGAVFWMWIVAIIGGASAFIESTLAQIYKKKNSDGSSYGGPSYYIENALGSRTLGVIFALSLIVTYALGFNMLCAYNLQTSFKVYSFYSTKTQYIIGAVLFILTTYAIIGGGKRIIGFTSKLVPLMGIIYVVVSLIMIIKNIAYIPTVFSLIFKDAFNFKAIFGAVAGSSMIHGIKRGLYSNEAGIGSAPNAAASAMVDHPAKQGLVQMLSVFIDTLLICSATAFMVLASGIEPTAELDGAPYVQQALETLLGGYGNYFITICLLLFGFTTLIGNIYYVDSNINYIIKGSLGKTSDKIFKFFCGVVIFVGAILKTSFAWDLAGLLMGIMALINLPSILLLSKYAIRSLKDYEDKRKTGDKTPFKSSSIGLNGLDFWN